ncbi:translation initiation factor-like protein eIF-2B subunit beta [Bisporella sp. PMI_857]|nr:translation initiation factor-like protein eIF-2B subunit beta [Bisporella sp. PMI_857]
MAPAPAGHAPYLSLFLKSLKANPVEVSIENLISLLKRRQIINSRSCAIATAHLLLHVVAKLKWTGVDRLLGRVQEVGQRLMEAQPREMAVGNIVRRVLGMIRGEAEADREEDTDSATNSQVGSPRRQHIEQFPSKAEGITSALSSLRFEASDALETTKKANGDDPFVSKPASARPPLMGSHTSHAAGTGAPIMTSMFNLLSATASPADTPEGSMSPHSKSGFSAASLSKRIALTSKNIKSEVINGIEEIIDELDQVDDLIAGYALDHIHSNEVILTHTSSTTVQRFLLKAASKRKFTVIVVESFPNNHTATHATVAGQVRIKDEGSDEIGSEAFAKPLSATGVTVILIPDSAVFAIMSRVNKVILATHAVIANGGLVAAAGARIIATAANVHKVPVIVVSGVYKLNPDYPFEFESLIEYGDPGKIVPYDNGELVSDLEIDNPVYDYVPPDLVNLYITNLGAHAPSYLYRIVADHYKTEDISFHKPEFQFGAMS